jgi:hypothetical protein
MGRDPIKKASHPRGYIQLFTCQREPAVHHKGEMQGRAV